MSNQIIDIVISVFPSVLALITFAGVIARVLKAFADLKKTVIDMRHVEALNKRLDAVLRENEQLKHTLDETMTKIDHVNRR